MRELDFTEKNLRNRWLGVKSIWSLIQGETRVFVKRRLERAMHSELSTHVGCNRYERSPKRRGHRNGSYARSLLTSYGWIDDLSVPRIREGCFETKVFEKYRRRQRAVDLVLLEAFLLGCATRKVRRLCRRVFGSDISPQGVSNIVHELDDEVNAFHRRALDGKYQVIYLDGLWITLSKPVKVKKVLLAALGIRHDGTKELLSFQLVSSESESCWWGFLSDLKDRGLSSMEVIVSDGAPGLVKAIQALYPRSAHQLCTFHKAMDLGHHLTDKRHRRRIISDALYIFEATTESEMRARLHIFIDKWMHKEPKAVRNFMKGFEYCLVYLEYDDPVRTRLKTNNPIERYFEEIRRRIIPMRAFNNIKSVERIVYGIIAYVLNNKQDMPNYQFTQFA